VGDDWWAGGAWIFVEVGLARPPSVFVRDLGPDEAARLRRISRRSKVFALRQRAQIILASDSKVGAPQIAQVLQTDENQVRRVIVEFNADGMDSLRPPTGGGHPRRIAENTREKIRGMASPVPAISVSRAPAGRFVGVRRYLVRQKVLRSISKEHLRRLLNQMGITAQRTRTWKWSNDPLCEQKKQWVLGAYKAAEAGTLDGVLVSFDGCGPISLKPHPGRGWFAKSRPAPRGPPTSGPKECASCSAPTTSAPTACGVISSPARSTPRWCWTSSRTSAAATGPRCRSTSSWMDCPRIGPRRSVTGAVANRVGLLPTPTNASHLNRIECHFWAYVEFVINGSDYTDWTEFSKATQAYIRRRNRDHHDPVIRELEKRRKVA
jgi:transposase